MHAERLVLYSAAFAFWHVCTALLDVNKVLMKKSNMPCVTIIAVSTGYVKIIDAVRIAATKLCREVTSEEINNDWHVAPV